MNFTESFDQFTSRLSTMDLALYAGIGIVLWVLFKDRLSPVQELLLGVLNKVKNIVPNKPVDITVPQVVNTVMENAQKEEDVFFKLVVSWKQTRDLAEKCGCADAVKVADDMFPYLSPKVCSKKGTIL